MRLWMIFKYWIGFFFYFFEVVAILDLGEKQEFSVEVVPNWKR